MPTWILGHEEQTDLWSLNYDEEIFVAEKPEKSRLDYALRLKFYCIYGQFPKQTDNIPDFIINYVADLIESPDTNWPSKAGRTARRRNQEVKEFLGYEVLSGERHEAFLSWYHAQVAFLDMPSIQIDAQVRQWCIARKYEPPTSTEINLLIERVHSKFESAECTRITKSLPDHIKELMLLSINAEPGLPSIMDLRSHPGRVGRDNFNLICERLQFINELEFPHQYIQSINEDWRKSVIRRMARLRPIDIRRMKDDRQLGMYAVYLTSRIPEITDSLITMLVDSVHKIETKAIRNIQKHISKQVHNIYNFQKTLSDILEATFENPNETAADLIFQIIDRKDALAFIDQQKSKNKWAIDVFNEMHGSWRTHYRPMLRNLLNAVEFGSTVSKYRPILDALEWIRDNYDNRSRIRARDKEMPIEGVVPNEYIKGVIRGEFIDKLSYELCTIITLRKKLGTREIWVPGSEKYKNPEDDIPVDFEERRIEYYEDLNLDIDGRKFVAQLKQELKEHLLAFDQEFAKNKFVQINHANKKPTFKISPLDALPEPAGLIRVKAQIAKQWPMTSLLDMMKETMLDTGFDRAFQSIGLRQNLPKPALNTRLLLCLYGLGTNAGLKRISAASNNATYEQLRHIRRRFIDVPSLREANQTLVNAILGIRNPAIWGEVGTAIASDSKQFKAWDKNPMSENHMRYGGNGVMAYWSVEGRSACIYSELKRVSEREDASMIKGVLNHCSDMSVDTAYVDSHGQTEVAFAFSRLLGFDLAPRIKRVGHSKLYSPSPAFKNRLPNIGQMVPRDVNWQRISRYYDDMVKYTTAMKKGTTSPEIVLRRFSRNNYGHPTYKALAELGRVVKTIFVCRYLRSKQLRREINEGLNVVENWNSATNFVYFGRGGVISSNRQEDQEIAIQALHLLQNCMVYMNTHMFQNVLADPEWKGLMKKEDYRGITPLIYNHVTPYGHFDINLEDRIFNR